MSHLHKDTTQMLREYFNGKADVWDRDVAEQDTGRLRRMVERLELKPGSVVLDVGTGTGIFLSYLLRSIGKKGKIVALDVAEGMLARARIKNIGGNIDCLQADIMEIPLRGGTFDSIVCYSSFPHFQDKQKALTEMRRVMKGGGRLFICHTSSRAEINKVHSQIPTVKNDILPDADEMRLLLSTTGFSGINVEEDSESYFASAVKPR